MKRLEKKHPLAVRWFHWINVPLLSIMIWSGMLIYWSNDVYRVGLGGVTLFHFFPDWFYSALNLQHRLAEGMAWHFLFMWFFSINGFLYVLYTIFSGEWRFLLPNRHTPREASTWCCTICIFAQAAAAAEIQRRPAAGLHRRHPDGAGLVAHGTVDL